MFSAARLRHIWLRRARAAEAMILLLLAKCLIRAVPLHRWRATLGRIGDPVSAQPGPAHRTISRSVADAARKLPGEYVCLPRAMAVQWMLRRRGLASAIVFGVAPPQTGGKPFALHAWVEVGGHIIIGDDPTINYARGLMLVQP